MPTWRALWRQRSRWQRGALENIGAYGLTRTTAIYWRPAARHRLRDHRLPVHFLLLMLITAARRARASRSSGVLARASGCIFLVERVVTVWAAGWRGRLLAAAAGDRARLRRRSSRRSTSRRCGASPPAAPRAGTPCPREEAYMTAARHPAAHRDPGSRPGSRSSPPSSGQHAGVRRARARQAVSPPASAETYPTKQLLGTVPA